MYNIAQPVRGFTFPPFTCEYVRETCLALRMRASLLLAAALCGLAAAQTIQTQLWPMPQSVNCPDGSLSVASTLSVTTNSNSATLNAAIQRYTAIYKPFLGPSIGVIRTLMLTVASGDDSLTPATNYTCVLPSFSQPRSSFWRFLLRIIMCYGYNVLEIGLISSRWWF